MKKKLKLISAFIVFWVALFIGWEWWYSYPKIRFETIVKTSSNDSQVDSILQNALSTYLIPGVSVAVVKQGNVKYLNAIGYQNLEFKDSLKVDSPILLASVSKIFTALALAEVFSNKNIASQDKIGNAVMKPTAQYNSIDQIRVKDLLSHQSGIKDQSISQRLFSSSKTTNLNTWAVDYFQDMGPKKFKNSKFHYADANFDLLGYYLSKSENHPFDSIVRNEIFIPSGMVNTHFITEWPEESITLTGYQPTFIWKRMETRRIKFHVLPSPSSGMLSTTKDMSMALVHLLREDMGRYQHALEWLKNSDGHLAGFQVLTIGNHEWQGHFGGQAGYSSLMFYSKTADIGVFIFANSTDEVDFRMKLLTQLITYFSQKSK
jgi:CubicO group peptidase (beta-lactamase class C family)